MIPIDKFESMQKGNKLDDGKARWDLLDFKHLNNVAEVLTAGAAKYSPDNWKKVPDAKNRYFAALLRHIAAYKQGELVDKEDGLSHLAHAACNLMFLDYFERGEK